MNFSPNVNIHSSHSKPSEDADDVPPRTEDDDSSDDDDDDDATGAGSKCCEPIVSSRMPVTVFITVASEEEIARRKITKRSIKKQKYTRVQEEKLLIPVCVVKEYPLSMRQHDLQAECEHPFLLTT